MMFFLVLSFTAALLCTGMAVFVFLQDRRSLAHQAFAAGMLAFALEAVCFGVSVQTLAYSQVVYWQQLQIVATALLPGSWLLFSLSFARARSPEFVMAWRWPLIAAFAFPLALVILFHRTFFTDLPTLDPLSRWVLGLGWPGYAFSLWFLLSTVLILTNLEWTLRASAGGMRWQLKFMILGVGGVFAVRLYTSSQALLFSSVTMAQQGVNVGALVVASGLILLSLVRARLSQVEVYFSQPFLYNSLTVLIVGSYLLVVSVLARVIGSADGGLVLPIQAFIVFLAFLGLAVGLLSDELRFRFKQFVSRHFRRPRYDYRAVWTAFTRQTTSLLDTQALCEATAKMASETFGVASVSIWLLDETQEHLTLGGSTAFSDAQARGLQITNKAGGDFIQLARGSQLPLDWKAEDADRVGRLSGSTPDSLPNALREAGVRYSVSLVAGEEFLGVMTIGEKITREPFSIEDCELLKTIADQTASSLCSLKLSLQLAKAKELEAFQTLSTFFIHDLKNLASTLSLTMRNLPTYYDDPAFREDALRVITNSVDKMNVLCGRLSLLTKPLKIQRTDVDLNTLVRITLADLNGAVQATLTQNLQPLPRLSLDSNQLQKVLVNLILNANEATDRAGKIHVTTAQKNEWVILSVSDNGCGMSQDFKERSLFHPFKTTKSNGVGIGLFQSKMIVEAHHGRIEVESAEGRGSVFRVVLPVLK